MDGILLIDKPGGLTSAEIVRRIKQLLGTKVGHLGTLDPFASGVLPLCVGAATKIAQFLNTAAKSYMGSIHLGVQTDSGDRTGRPVRTAPVPPVTEVVCLDVAARFLGEQWQTPPMYSAIKQQGVPLYKLARRGVEVERQARRIDVTELQLEPDGPERLRFRVSCSKGTYVRVLAEDIGTALGTAAYLETLRRTRFGYFDIARAVPLEIDRNRAAAALVSPRQALRDLPEIQLDRDAARRVRLGQVAVLRSLPPPGESAATAKLIDPSGELLAVVTGNAAGAWGFARVLAGVDHE